jgi:D-alanyl-D-alanine carboxypeptidase
MLRCVASGRVWPLLALVVSAAALVASLLPTEAEARKRRGGGYNPPYADIVMDVNAGRVLRGTNADALRHPASVTKVMTLYLLFEQLERGRFKLDSELRVSAHAASRAPSKIGFDVGDTIEVEDAIKALVTKSANDVASVVAEAIAGDEDEFAELMTRKARALGMSRTVFKNASGLPHPAQVTTARDLALLGRAVHDHFPRYWRYFQTRDFAYSGAVYRNHNRLLGRVDGVDGIKTGFTRASGFNLLTSAKVGNRHIIAVVLGGRSGRIRDAQMASLVGSHLPTAYAGARLGPAVAQARTDEEPRQTVAQIREPVREPARQPERQVAAERPVVAERQVVAAAAAPAPQAPAVVPVPRPQAEPARAAAIIRPQAPRDLTPPAPAARAVAVAGTGVRLGGQTNVSVTTPNTPGMRWVVGAQPALQARVIREPLRTLAADERRAGGQAVAYTNSIATRASEDNDDDEAVTAAIPASAAAPTAPPRRAEPAKAETAKPEVAAKPEAPKKVAEAARPAEPARTGWVIQIGATDDERKARAMLESLKARHRAALADADPFTEKVQKGDTTLYRARFGGFEAADAQAACRAVKAGGTACFAQRI